MHRKLVLSMSFSVAALIIAERTMNVASVVGLIHAAHDVKFKVDKLYRALICIEGSF